MSTPQQFVEEAVQNNSVVVFGKSYCRKYALIDLSFFTHIFISLL